MMIDRDAYGSIPQLLKKSRPYGRDNGVLTIEQMTAKKERYGHSWINQRYR
jgi:hypothetical protein